MARDAAASAPRAGSVELMGCKQAARRPHAHADTHAHNLHTHLGQQRADVHLAHDALLSRGRCATVVLSSSGGCSPHQMALAPLADG